MLSNYDILLMLAPVMFQLKAKMAPNAPLVQMGHGPEDTQKEPLLPEDMCPMAKRLKDKLRQEVEENWCHVTVCEQTLQMCTAMDSRFKLSHFSKNQHCIP